MEKLAEKIEKAKQAVREAEAKVAVSALGSLHMASTSGGREGAKASCGDEHHEHRRPSAERPRAIVQVSLTLARVLNASTVPSVDALFGRASLLRQAIQFFSV